MAGTTELRRGNGISRFSGAEVVPTKLSIQSSVSLAVELTSLKAAAATTANAYTSLRDILPSPPVNSPSSAAAIRNRLVKQAAWAYLQPMSASPSSSSRGPRFLRRLWLRLAAAGDGDRPSCLCFLVCHVIRAVDRLLALFQLPAWSRQR